MVPTAVATLLATLVVFATPSFAAVMLTNGSFEQIGAQYSGALGGLYEATGWTNLSGLNIQASSGSGGEGVSNAGFTGSRYLRLVADGSSVNNVGTLTQYLGTMTAGETYQITADAFSGTSANTTWGGRITLSREGVAEPSLLSTLSTSNDQSLNSNGMSAAVFFNVSYTALPTDNGAPLYVILRAKGPHGATNRASRGGLDNVQLTVTSAVPEPASLSLLALCGAAIALRGRRRGMRNQGRR